ncbi:PASTA domain-containing protein [Nonomuraea sp. bgisy101]|uniref:PASTA domain-containing protein n=1 Tax=Nonomuraea sp. bgisy101 TaxID=3413784 RepID=UPI003D716564
MKVEEALTDAMAASVAEVEAPPTLGGGVRRRHRVHVLRFRTAGAALAVAVLAAGAPVYLAATAGPEAAGVTSGTSTVRVVTKVAVPDVTNKTFAEAQAALQAAGLVGEKTTGDEDVFGQDPKPGVEVETGSTVKLYLVDKPPNALGDLGDGRAFGGITLGYLPDGLVWGSWSNKWPGPSGGTSYTTTFDAPDTPAGHYGIQVFVHEGEVGERVDAAIRNENVQTVDIGDRRAYLSSVSEGGDHSRLGTQQGAEPSTPTIGFRLTDDLAVEVAMNPERAEKIGMDAVAAELKKIAEGVRASK